MKIGFRSVLTEGVGATQPLLPDRARPAEEVELWQAGAKIRNLQILIPKISTHDWNLIRQVSSPVDKPGS